MLSSDEAPRSSPESAYVRAAPVQVGAEARLACRRALKRLTGQLACLEGIEGGLRRCVLERQALVQDRTPTSDLSPVAHEGHVSEEEIEISLED